MGTNTDRIWQGRVFTTVSLDGYIASPGGDALWTTRLPADLNHVSVSSDHPALSWEQFYEEVDVVMLGRLSYERLQHADLWPFEDKPVYVVSRTFPPGDPRVVDVFRKPVDAIETVNKLGADSVHVDGGRNIQGFLKRGLIEEITVQIAPVLLGGGIPLFGESDAPVNLRLEGSDVTDAGFVRVTYAVH